MNDDLRGAALPRVLIEYGSDVFWRTGPELCLEYVSPNVTRFLGYSPAEMLGRPVTDFVEWEHDQQVPATLDEGSVTLRGIAVCRDGSRRWFENHVLPMRAGDGSVVGFTGVFHDIDRQVRAERDLADSEHRYRMLAEHASEVVVQGGVDGVIDWVSPSVREALGLDPADVVGRPVVDLIHPDDHQAVRDAQAVLATGRESHFEARFLRADGSPLWNSVLVRPICDEAGTIVGRIASWRDIDREHRQREALRESEEHFRLLAINASDVVVQTANDGTVQWLSPSIEDILGYRIDDLLGRHVVELVHPDDIGLVVAAQRAALEGEPARFEARYRKADGEHTWMSVVGRPLFDDSGTVVGRVASARRVDDERAAAEALARATEAAQAANLAKTQFLSRMSHELRTPLNAVLGFAQLLGMDDLTDDQRAAVEQILRGGRHLLDLINEVLDIARIESGRVTLSPEPVMAADVVSEALELVRPLASQRDVTIAWEGPRGCERALFVDRQRTIQVLLNLLANAIKYNRDGGRVEVRCSGAGEQCEIAVSDTGIGIAAEDLPKVFEPFERLAAGSSGVEGNGIGLPLSRGLAELMGGGIGVESTPGVGSTFTVALPFATVAAAPALGVDVLAGPAVQSDTRRVLYVEDNPANAELMTAILSRRPGVAMEVAPRGDEALASIRSDAPDLVLLDLHLPDTTGEEVLRGLRSDPSTSDVPVVVLTADAAPHVRRRLLALGADAFLSKPVDVARLLAWIDDPQQSRRSS